MKVTLKNVGPLTDASFEVGDLTVICGENNTGKTYATYALYGFLSEWQAIATAQPKLMVPMVDFRSSGGQIDLESLLPRVDELINRLADVYAEGLGAVVFGASEGQFAGARFQISSSGDVAIESARRDAIRQAKYEISIVRAGTGGFGAVVTKAVGSMMLETTRADPAMSLGALHKYAAAAVADLLIKPRLPPAFIASAERTGAAVFRRELDFARTRALEATASAMPKEAKNARFRSLVANAHSGYPLPVEDNVEFVRELEVIARDQGPLAGLQPDLLVRFTDLLGGEFRVQRNGPSFVPTRAKRVRLSMPESSGSVRALLDVGFYLRHAAKPGDMLMIDEPELNLHPKNQRKLARLLVALVNAGVRVFITTHSDYIIREFNTLIMLNRGGPDEDAVRQKFGYAPTDRLDASRVRLYTTQRSGRSGDIVLTPARISASEGIEVATFDQTIGEMNRIQDMLQFGAAQ